MQGEDGVCRVQCDNSQCLSGVGIDFCLKFWCFLWFLVGVCVCVCVCWGWSGCWVCVCVCVGCVWMCGCVCVGVGVGVCGYFGYMCT